MTKTTTFSNGQVLTSSAHTPDELLAVLQSVTCTSLGLPSYTPRFIDTITASTSTVKMQSIDGLAVGYFVFDTPPSGAPQNLLALGTTITGINQATKTITLSQPVLNVPDPNGDPTPQLYFSAPSTNTVVRVGWPPTGAPAWAITDDVAFITGSPESNLYDKLIDERIVTGAGITTKYRTYTRVWRIQWDAYGPNCVDNMRVLRSTLTMDITSDPLASFSLYGVPDMEVPTYAPDLFEGQWWNRAVFEASFYEEVQETITIPTVQSVELTGNTDDRTFDTTVTI